MARPKLPITTDNIKIYGSAVWNHWLAGRYGDQVVRTAWERAAKVKPAGYSIDAYNVAIRAAARSAGRSTAGKDLPHEFARFAATTAEWRTPGVFPYPDAALWDDVERGGKLRPGRFITRNLSHTGYLLFRVAPQAGWRDAPARRRASRHQVCLRPDLQGGARCFTDRCGSRCASPSAAGCAG